MTDTPTEREAEGIWARLRRRKVVQWGLAYVASAWALLEGIAFFADVFGWPHQSKRIGSLLLVVGLPIVLVLAWYHGDRGQQRVSRPELALLAFLGLVGGGVLWFFGNREPAMPAPDRATTVARPSSTPVAAADARPSIAVLPFDNRSRLADDAYFVDGIHDDILTQLTRIGALKVIARTSVQQFRDTQLTTREIGEKLGVTRILEGAVQRAGHRVRVTVQLIDAATSAHLWAESYDRELTAANLFAIQSEVAVAIADALQTRLSPAERTRVNDVLTQDLQAWEHYQLGQQWLAKRSKAGFTSAIEHFEEAIATDPGFARAHAGLAVTLIIQSLYEYAPQGRAFAEAEVSIGRALTLDPDLAEARATLGVLYLQRGDSERAAVELRKAIALNPNYAPAHQWYADALLALGRFDDALQASEAARALDPLSVIINISLGAKLEARGRLDDALAAYRRALDIDPTLSLAYANIATLHAVTEGRFDEGMPYLVAAAEVDPGEVTAWSYRGYQYLNLQDDARAEYFLDRALQLSAEGVQSLDWMATLYLYQGKHAKALDYARRSFAIAPRVGWSVKLLRNAEIATGNWPAARALYAKAFPELLDAAPPTITEENLRAAIDLALVLQQGGEHVRAKLLLERSEQFIGTIARTTWNGYWIGDAEIHALRGREREALEALRAADKARWRAFWRYYRDFEPNLASIRDEPEFKAVFAGIERDIVAQRARLEARLEDDSLDLPVTR